MSTQDKQHRLPAARRDEALVERLFRRVFESLGAAVDRRLGRDPFGHDDFTTSKLIERMRRAIDERVRPDERGQRIAPHLMRLKVEWGTHSEVAPEIVKELEHEILAAAIDHINDNRYGTLAPVAVETVTDIFTPGVVVEPTFSEFQEKLEKNSSAADNSDSSDEGDAANANAEVRFAARINFNGHMQERTLRFVPGGRRFNIGRASDNDLTLDHGSVSKVHATMRLTSDGKLMIADTGSTNGTFLNGRRLAYGEAATVEDGDVVGFGQIEMRLRRTATES